jgi:hydrogenase maturation protein HypF
LAHTLHLTGLVRNDTRGVTVEIQGDGGGVDAFLDRLQERSARDYPQLLEIVALKHVSIPLHWNERGFAIVESDSAGGPLSQVTPDFATCPDCLRELTDPDDFRFRYPFINCTHCGPRYSIVKCIPYDRPNTTMGDFPMCARCYHQYTDVRDRRFHAQPAACPECGPQLVLADCEGRTLQADSDEAIAACGRVLREGGIAAIKGIGGFHLAADACNETAVRLLRDRKRRDAKPFAMMAGSLDIVCQHCVVSSDEEQLLQSPSSPIVLLNQKERNGIAPSVAFGTNRFGFMLCYAPLHHLLFTEPGIECLVMTSANLSDEPLICDNAQALDELAGIADIFLMHNRGIYRQVDDSVMHVVDGRASFLRRARGYVPAPIYRQEPVAKHIFVAGADLKNTFCFVKNDQFLVSEHIGDLADGRVYRHYVRSVEHLANLFEVKPGVAACDLHPGYLSTYFAEQMPGVELVRIQHHWAHAASVLADAGHEGPVIALVADGTGYGTDGAIWGCECLVASLAEFRRTGHLAYFPLAGGDKASKEAIRPLVGLLAPSGEPDTIDLYRDLLATIEPDTDKLRLICTQIEKGLNTVQTSSLGRLFDAAAALVGMGAKNRFEAELPMALESIIAAGVDDHYPIELAEADGVDQWKHQPIIAGMVDDLRRQVDKGVIAARFHNSVSAGLLEMARSARRRHGLADVALSGGVFCNRYLAERLIRQLQEDGFNVLWKKSVPVNDGAISLGQAAIAAKMCEMGLIGNKPCV